MISSGSSSAKEEKENEAFFREVTICPHQPSLKLDGAIVKWSQMQTSSSETILFKESPEF